MKEMLIVGLVVSALFLVKELWYAWGLSGLDPVLKNLASVMGKPYPEPVIFMPLILTIAFGIVLWSTY